MNGFTRANVLKHFDQMNSNSSVCKKYTTKQVDPKRSTWQFMEQLGKDLDKSFFNV